MKAHKNCCCRCGCSITFLLCKSLLVIMTVGCCIFFVVCISNASCMQSKSAHPTTTAIANCNCCGSCLERLVVFAVFLEQQCLEEAFRYKSLSSSQEYMCGCTDFVFRKKHCIKVICVGSRCHQEKHMNMGEINMLHFSFPQNICS